MRILILGFGKSGQSAYKLLSEYDVDLYVYDQKKIQGVNYLSYDDLKKSLPLFDVCVRSPGVNRKSKEYWLSYNLSKKMISELELGLFFLKTKYIVAVTGTNGKTTTCKMIDALLSVKYKTHLVGNIGVPLTSLVNLIKEDDIVIMELSSYMLEDTFSLHPYISVITSLDENHQEGNLNLETYYSSKKRILFNCQNVIFSSSDINKKISFIPRKFENKYQVEANLSLTNTINLKTSLEVCHLFNLTNEEVNKGIKKIKIDKYRQEVINKGNIIFVNDSKSTSSEATNQCIEEFKDYEIVLILEGIFKGINIDKIRLFKVNKVYSYGKISSLLPSFVLKRNSLEEILGEIKLLKKDHLCVIFSPAGSSFDLYENYIKRGEHFEFLVNSLWK